MAVADTGFQNHEADKASALQARHTPKIMHSSPRDLITLDVIRIEV